MPRSLAQERENRECELIRDANMNARGRENREYVLVMNANREVLGGEKNEKGNEKTDVDSSVLLYFMTEEGERE